MTNSKWKLITIAFFIQISFFQINCLPIRSKMTSATDNQWFLASTIFGFVFISILFYFFKLFQHFFKIKTLVFLWGMQKTTLMPTHQSNMTRRYSLFYWLVKCWWTRFSFQWKVAMSKTIFQSEGKMCVF